MGLGSLLSKAATRGAKTAVAEVKETAKPVAAQAKRIVSNVEEQQAKAQQFVSEVEDSIQLTKPSVASVQPQKTVKAYKLFRTDSEGNLYPLFVDAKTPVPVGEWIQAKAGELTKEGKVKSSLGPLAYRPGWHAGDLPIATHIGGRYDPKTLQKVPTTKGSKPNVREDNQVWAEVELPADIDWQTVAESKASRVKSGPNKGQINMREAHITDQLPVGGHYRYKTNPNMTGNWLIGGEMKVNRVLSDEEVKAINDSAGVADLPRLSSLAEEYKKQIGFAQGGSIPGFQDGGNAVEPTTGNDVPIGSLPEEVADDIPAKLSTGEFVLPADVVRFIGLERLMKLRDEAKEGLRRMAEVGQMGNAEEVGEKAEENFEEEDTGKFESDIDEILSEVDSVEGQTEKAFAQGGVVGGPPWLTGFDMSKAPKNPVFDVRYYKHPDGRIMYVTFFNGKPMTPIPDGFTQTDSPVDQQVGVDDTKKTTTPTAPAAIDTTLGGGVGGEGESGTTGGPMSLEAAAQSIAIGNALSGYASGTKGLGPGAAVAGILGSLATNVGYSALSNYASRDVLSSMAEAQAEADAMEAGLNVADAVGMSGFGSTGNIGADGPSGGSTDSAGNMGLGGSEAGGAGDAGAGGGSDAGSGGDGGGYGGVMAKGGLVAKRKKPAKKTKGKGLASR